MYWTFEKKPATMILMLSDSQLKLLAETLSNLGIVFFASMVVPILIIPKADLAISMIGLGLSLTSWIASLLVVKNTAL